MTKATPADEAVCDGDFNVKLDKKLGKTADYSGYEHARRSERF